jgi:hypothetical protein
MIMIDLSPSAVPATGLQFKIALDEARISVG